MLASLSAWGLKLWLHGTGAPLWHTLATLDNSTTVNAVAAAITALCLGVSIVALAYHDRDNPPKIVPILLTAAFFVVPPFAQDISGLSPVMLSMLPISLALAALAFAGQHGTHGRGRCYWFMLSGAFAAVGVWESTLGVACAPLLLLATWVPQVRWWTKPSVASGLWFLGFALALVGEGFWQGFAIENLKPVLPPLAGLGIYFAIGVVPTMTVRTFKCDRRVIGGWGALLLVFLTITLVGGHYWGEGGCERFARTVLGELNGRKLIIGDGFTDDFFRVMKPKDVQFAGTRSNADRELLLNFFEADEPITNKALVVRNHHHLPEMDEAVKELGLTRRNSAKKPQNGAKPAADAKPTEGIVPVEVARSNMTSRIVKRAEPLLNALAALEEEVNRTDGQRDRAKMVKAAETVRTLWGRHAFGGQRISRALLTADLLLGDRQAVESDAITALLLDRADSAANGALGALRQEAGKLDVAERYLRKGVKGGGAFAMCKLAILLIQTGRPEEAVEWTRKAVKLAPGDRSFREPLAAALLESGKLDEAEAELNAIAGIVKAQGQSEKSDPFLTNVRKRLAELRREQRKKR